MPKENEIKIPLRVVATEATPDANKWLVQLHAVEVNTKELTALLERQQAGGSCEAIVHTE